MSVVLVVVVVAVLTWCGGARGGGEGGLVGAVLRDRGLTHVCLLTHTPTHVVSMIRGSSALWTVSDVGRNVTDVGGVTWRGCDTSTAPALVVVDSTCPHTHTQDILLTAGRRSWFTSAHVWLVVSPAPLLLPLLPLLPLSVDADLTFATRHSTDEVWELVEVFNFGRERGGALQTRLAATYTHTRGLEWESRERRRYKYYDRWDFQNLTLRAVTVVGVGGRRWSSAEGAEAVLTGEGAGGARGVSAMTRVSARLLHDLARIHNFRFNYTVVDRWVASPRKNATPGVTNTLYWREQDISMTCIRIFSNWLDWMDPFYPPTFYLETRFYYLSTGSESGENMFVRPLSVCAWCAVCVCAVLSAGAVGVSAAAQGHPGALLYGTCHVLAALAQQAYEDGIRLFETRISGQSRRWSLLVVGVWSLVVYNYYTSSVVSWLLVAAPPRLSDLTQLARSDLTLLFQDIGYTRSWLQSPGFYYYAGYERPEEDYLRNTKVGTRPVLRDLHEGLQLVRTDKYAYHAEPEEVSAVLGSWPQTALCQLGTLSMMPPSPVYIVAQKNSPYKEFFNWRLVRMGETGVLSRSVRLAPPAPPACVSRPPRPLALSPALPAFTLLAVAALLAVLLLLAEIIHHNYIRPRRSTTPLQ